VTPDSRRFVVYGAGAIGGVLGGRMCQHGDDVTLVARGAHLDAIRERGLTIQSPDDTVTVDVPAVGHPRDLDLRDGDVVILAMKSHDTRPAVEALAEVVPPGVAVACAQNGVSNERDVLRHFASTYGVCVMCPATHLEPGVVQAFAAPVSGGFDVGRYPQGVDDTARDIAAAMSASSFSAAAVPDVMRWKHTKLLMNLANAVEALCGRDGRRDDGHGMELVGRLVDEGRAVLQAAGIAFASPEEDAERRSDLSRMRPIDGQRRAGGSSWQSLARGLGSIETDHLNGEIVLLGRLHGVPTPANELVQRLANEAARARVPPGSTAAADIVAALDTAPS
jgi:2-dehydropantoate 2-reductase